MSAARETVGRAKGPPSSLTLLPQAGEGNSQLPSPQGGEGLGVRWPRRRAIARRPTTGSVQLESRAEAEA
jgi:hypothetical protein